jgi:xylan 1,4-beta-xylosidase
MRHLVSIVLLCITIIATLLSCKQSIESGIFFGDPVISATEDPVKLLFPGNWADPTIVKVDNIYYLTSNNDQYVPSVLVFQSTDLKHWVPLSYASPLEGQGPATDIAAVGERLFIYGGGNMEPWVMYADPPYEVWSERINLEPLANHSIDAGHIMDQEGNRYLYMADGKMVKLSGDGLNAQTAPEEVYDGWEIPDEIAIECVCLESPKLFRRDDWYYMVSATGGTAGPSTSHMAIVARAQNPDGPWINSPYNPMIWTRDESELWWSKGHATLIEGPEQEWFAIYHGYRHGQRSWGRSTLISPVEWNNDGWPLLAPKWPGGWDDPLTLNLPLSDEFDGDEIGMQWQAYGKLDTNRYKLLDDAIEIMAVEGDPGYSNPLTANPRDLAYEVETELVIEGEIHAGLILFYSPDAYITLGLTPDSTLLKHKRRFHSDQGQHLSVDNIPYTEKRIRLKIRNDRQDASFYYSTSDEEWIKLERSDDVSGFQHNVHGSFSSIRPGFFVTGKGKARFEFFRYTVLPQQK